MSLDITSLAIKVTSEGIDQATKSLSDLAIAANKLEKDVPGVKAVMSAMAASQKSSADAAEVLMAKLQKQSDLLGANSSQVAAYAAAMKGLTDVEQTMASMLGAEVDAYKRLASDQGDALRMNKDLDDSYKALARDAEAYYAAMAKAKAAGDTLNQAGQRAEEYKKLGLAQAEAISMNKALDASNKALENDHGRAILEDKRRTYQALSAAQSEALAINKKMDTEAATANAEARAFVENLKRQADQVGMTTKQLKEYNAEQIRTRAATLGVSHEVEGYVEKIKSAKGLHESFNLLTAGSARELMVLGHELSQGNFQRFGGSLIVLAERVNFLPSLLEKASATAASFGMSLGVLIGTVAALAAGIAAAAYTYYKSYESLHQLNNEVILTGHSIGVTGDALYAMSNRLGEVTGHFAEARKATAELAATGKFTASQIDVISNAAVRLNAVAGISIDDTVKQFEKLAAEPMKGAERGFNGVSKAAIELDAKLHFLEPTVLSLILHYENVGNAAAASKLAINALATEETKRAIEMHDKLTDLGKVAEATGMFFKTMWHNLWDMPDMTERLADAQRKLKDLQTMNGVHPEQTHQANLIKEVADLQSKIKKDADAESASMAKKEVDRQNNLRIIERDRLLDRARGGDTLQDALIRNAQAEQAAVESGLNSELFSDENNHRARLKIAKDFAGKKKKEITPGLSGLDLALNKINAEAEIEKRASDNSIRLIDFKLKHKLISETDAEAQKETILNKELTAEKEQLDKSLAAVASFHAADERQANNAASKKEEFIKRLGKVDSDIKLKQAENALGPAAALQKGADAATKIFEATEKQDRKTLANLQDQIDAYNLLPEAMRKAGVTAKQLKEFQVQAEIDGLEALKASTIELNNITDPIAQLAIRRLEQQIALKKQIRDADSTVAKNATANTNALAEPARLKAEAAAQAEIWKSTGNEIEKALVNAFSKAGKAAGEMFKLYDEGQAKQIQITQKIVEAEDRKAHGVVTAQKTIDDLKSQSAMVELATYANMVGAAKSYFDSSSDGYRAMAAAEKILTIISVAESAKRLYAAAMANIPLTITVAAVAGLAAIFGGGKHGPNIAEIQKLQSTGSVLGSNDAKSDSIAKSLTILEKNSGLGLAQGNDMVGYLKSVSDNISNLSSLIVRTTNITGKTAPASVGGIQSLASSIPVVGNIVGKVLGSIFGGKTTVDDTGFTSSATTVGGVASSGFNANQYTDTTKSGGWFSSDKHNTSVSSLGADANDQFSKIILGMASSITAASKLIGIGGDAFTKHLNEFVIDIGKISLKGLTGEQIQKELEAVFSKIGDDMAKFAFEGLAKFQKVGEGYFETVSRIANDLIQVKDVFAVLGKSMLATGMDAIDVSEQLITAAGGLDKLTKGTKYFIDNFLTDAEKIAPIAASVDKRLSELGQSNIKTIDQYKALVKAQDLNTTGGQTLYAALLDLAPAFKAVSDEADKAVTAALDIAKKKRELEIQLLEAQGKAEEALAARRFDELAALTKLDPALAALQQQIYDASAASVTLSTIQKVFTDNLATAKSNLQAAYQRESTALQSVIDKFKAFSESLKKFKDSLLTGNLSTLSPEQKYLQAKLKFQSTSALAATGNEGAIAELQNVSQEFLDASKGYNASTEAYARDFDLVQKGLSEGAAAADAQVSIAQSQLSIMTAQYNSLLGIQAGVLSFKDALSAYTQASANATMAGVGPAPSSSGGAFFGPAEIEASLKAIQAAAGLPVTGLYVANTPEALLGGSHAGGLDFVPRDNYLANLHRGERVQTAARASASDENSAKVVALTQELIAKVSKVEEAIAAGNNQRGAIHTEQVEVLGEVKEGLDKVKRAVVAK